MPIIPTTYADKSGVVAAGAAPKMGQKLSINAMDAPYEHNIASLKQLPGAADRLMGGIKGVGAEINDYLATEKKKEDIASFSQARDHFLENAANFDETSMEQAKDPETGEIVFSRFGADLDSQGSAYMGDALGRVNANEEVRGMMENWYTNTYHGAKQQDIIKKRIGWQKEKTNLYYEDKINQAVENADASEGIAMATLQALNDGKLSAELPTKIRQIKGMSWFNQQKAITQINLLNTKPLELEDSMIPPYFKDKDEVRQKLESFRRYQIAYQKDNFAKYKAEKDDYIMKTLGKKEANDEFFKKMREEKGFGEPLYSEKEMKAYETMNANMLLKNKKAATDKVINDFQWEIEALEEGKANNPQYNSDKAKILSKVNETLKDYGDATKVKNTFASAATRFEKVANMNDTQRADRTKFKDAMFAQFGWDSKEKGFSEAEYGVYQMQTDVSWLGNRSTKPVISPGLMFDATSNIMKSFDNWAIENPNWTSKEGREKMIELKAPYIKEAYKLEVMEIEDGSKDANITKMAKENGMTYNQALNLARSRGYGR